MNTSDSERITTLYFKMFVLAAHETGIQNSLIINDVVSIDRVNNVLDTIRSWSVCDGMITHCFDVLAFLADEVSPELQNSALVLVSDLVSMVL